MNHLKVPTLGESFDLKNCSKQELINLIERFPYFQNLYYQLLDLNKKAEAKDEIQALLPKVATYASDRSFLFEYFNQQPTKTSPAEEEQLTLNKIEEEKTLQLINITPKKVRSEQKQQLDFPPRKKEAPAKEVINDLLESSDFFEDEGPSSFTEFISPEKLIPEDADQSLSMLEKIVATSPAQPFKATHEFISFMDTFHLVTEDLHESRIADERGDMAPQDVSPLELIYPPIDLNKKESTSRVKPLRKAFPSKKSAATSNAHPTSLKVKTADPNAVKLVEESAEKSIMESQEIASETLAELLIVQEQYAKALSMYKRLILIFPEKSAFFAERIKYINKILEQ